MRARGQQRMQLELKTKKETPPRAAALQGFFTDRRYVSLCGLITSAEIRRGLGCVNATGGWRAPFPPSSPLRPRPVPSSWALLKPVYRLFYLIESRGLLFKVLKFKSSARPLPSAIDMRNIAGLPDSPAPSARPPLMASDAMKIRKRAGPSRKKETGERVRDARLKRLRRRVISPIHKTYIHIGDGERGGWVDGFVTPGSGQSDGDSVNRSARNKIARPRDDNRRGPLPEFRPMNIYLND